MKESAVSERGEKITDEAGVAHEKKRKIEETSKKTEMKTGCIWMYENH